MVRPRLKGGPSGVVIGDGVAHRDVDTHFLRSLDKLHGARLLGGQGDQTDTALRRLLEALQHSGVRVVEVVAVLGALLGHAQEGAFQVGTHHLRAPGVFLPVGGGGLADGGELVLGEGHAGGADIGNSLRQLIVGDFL